MIAGAWMGHSRKRLNAKGKARFTAYYYNERGQRRSAGTFSNEKAADKEWQKAETKVAEGRMNDPRRGRQTVREYVETKWLPNHVIEPSTRQGYTYSLNANIMPTFGDLRMMDILPSDVREWVQELLARGMSPATVRSNRFILSAIFTTALNDRIIAYHPCKGVKTPTVPKKQLQIVTPVQFDLIYVSLPTEDFRLLSETDIESGLRWGELTELRPKDLNSRTCLLTVSRAVVQLDPKFHPDGARFLVKKYPKDGETRRFMLSKQIVTKLDDHQRRNNLGPDDLYFSLPGPSTTPRRYSSLDPSVAIGLTEPNSAGRQYAHGTLSGYSAGACRCPYCRRAYADYRAGRRAAGKDAPRPPRRLDTDGHIPRDWFRMQIWQPAVAAAGIGIHVRARDLRHAHASWLLAGGADLQVVKERLGHGSIATTEKYLHTLPTADTTALNALDKIRRGAA